MILWFWRASTCNESVTCTSKNSITTADKLDYFQKASQFIFRTRHHSYKREAQAIKKITQRSHRLRMVTATAAEAFELSNCSNIHRVICTLRNFDLFKISNRNTIQGANDLDPDQDQHLLVLIWVQTVCKGYQQRLQGKC